MGLGVSVWLARGSVSVEGFGRSVPFGEPSLSRTTFNVRGKQNTSNFEHRAELEDSPTLNVRKYFELSRLGGSPQRG
jgi:hypothetical protein